MPELELLIENRSSGQTMDAGTAVQYCEWITNRTGSPGRFAFSLLKHPGLKMEEGDTVRFSSGGKVQFYGWIFTRSEDRWGVVTVTCYDRLRYLKANASYAFYAQTAADILRQIAGDLQLDVGEVADTGYQLPSLVEQDQTCLDIMADALDQTLLNTGKIYVLYDDGTGLALQEPAAMKCGTVIGDGSLLTEYTFATDIDKQTYNSVKLARPNEQTGHADVYLAQNSEHIGQWGLLQLYQTVDGDTNEAMIKAQAQATLEYYDRARISFQLTALGIDGLRAGQLVYIRSAQIGDSGLDQYVLLDRVSHRWENGVHTMELEAMDL